MKYFHHRFGFNIEIPFHIKHKSQYVCMYTKSTISHLGVVLDQKTLVNTINMKSYIFYIKKCNVNYIISYWFTKILINSYYYIHRVVHHVAPTQISLCKYRENALGHPIYWKHLYWSPNRICWPKKAKYF